MSFRYMSDINIWAEWTEQGDDVDRYRLGIQLDFITNGDQYSLLFSAGKRGKGEERWKRRENSWKGVRVRREEEGRRGIKRGIWNKWTKNSSLGIPYSRKLSRIGGKYNFCGENFHGFLACATNGRHAKFHWETNSHKTSKFAKIYHHMLILVDNHEEAQSCGRKEGYCCEYKLPSPSQHVLLAASEIRMNFVLQMYSHPNPLFTHTVIWTPKNWFSETFCCALNGKYSTLYTNSRKEEEGEEEEDREGMGRKRGGRRSLPNYVQCVALFPDLLHFGFRFAFSICFRVLYRMENKNRGCLQSVDGDDRVCRKEKKERKWLYLYGLLWSML